MSRDATRSSRRQAFWLRAAFAAWGLALAAALVPHLQRLAPPAQVPGAMTSLGLDARGPFLGLAALLLLPFLAALAGNSVTAHLAGAPRWLSVTFGAALASAPLTVLYGGGLGDVLLHTVVAALTLIAFHAVHRGAAQPDAATPPATDPRTPPPSHRATTWLRLSRHDLLLVPTALVVYFAILDLAPTSRRPVICLLLAVLLSLALRLIAGRIAGGRCPGLALALAPLAAVLQAGWLPATGAAIAALAWVFTSSLALAFLLRGHHAERRLSALVALLVYPLFSLAYPLSLLGVHATPKLDFFEDGHELMPASEMMHGKRPFTDIAPIHGLMADGGLDLLTMKAGLTSTAEILQVRQVARCTYFPALYAITLAATGAADAGLLAVLLAVTLFPSIGLRAVPALLALAATLVAMRQRSPRWFMVSGALIVAAALVSFDFAGYSALVTVVAVLRSRQRRRALTCFAAGLASAASAMLVALGAMGSAGAFLRTTLHEIPASAGAYILGPLAATECLQGLTRSAAAWLQPECFRIVLWCIIVVLTGAAVAGSLWRATRSDGLWLIGMWIGLAAASYAERRHNYAGVAMAAFLVAGLFLLSRQRAKGWALALALFLAWLANPLGHLFATATPMRAASFQPPTGSVEIRAMPRCRGLWMDASLRPPIRSIKHFVDSTLRADETWFDFTNHAVLYYLFDRRCPIRQQEIPLIETAESQREVIARLQRDLSVRAVLIAFPDSFTAIDGIANRQRAPLVAQYLDTAFAPAFAENGVAFWRRKP